MMRFLRNAEVLKSAIWLFLLSALFTAGAFIWHVPFGWFTLALCVAFLLVYFGVTYRRYRRIAQLSEDIDRILHGEGATVSLDRYAEGELGILQNEVHKMTVRLREQQVQLQNDKVYLADSIADISHQIRTPLTAINLLVQLLSESDLDTARRAALTQELISLLSRIDWLITSLLKMSKLDAGTVRFKCEDMPLHLLIQKAVSPLAVATELRGQALSITADGCFHGDLAWTAEAIGNVVKNCMEHTPNGGEIRITAAENALYTEILVQDNGCGIAPEDLPHIFERFYKGKNAGDTGFGIGLALARRIVTAQNGTLKAENAPEGGARFTLRFYKGII